VSEHSLSAEPYGELVADCLWTQDNDELIARLLGALRAVVNATGKTGEDALEKYCVVLAHTRGKR